MAANFNKPDLSSLEVDAVDEYKERDVDIAKMFDGTSSTNIPTNAIKFDVTAGVLQRREGGAWVTKALDIIDATTGTLSVSRGGTGATTASAARTNLSVPPTSLTISAGTGLNGGGSLSANRTLSVDVGTDSNQIPRNSDLGSAATTDATAYATSAQGDTADSALQSSDVGTASTKDVGTGPTNVPQNSDLGSAATTDATAYATSAQGDTADTALQPANNLSDVASAATSRSNLDVYSQSQSRDIVSTRLGTLDTVWTGSSDDVDFDTFTGGHPGNGFYRVGYNAGFWTPVIYIVPGESFFSELQATVQTSGISDVIQLEYNTGNILSITLFSTSTGENALDINTVQKIG